MGKFLKGHIADVQCYLEVLEVACGVGLAFDVRVISVRRLVIIKLEVLRLVQEFSVAGIHRYVSHWRYLS